MSASADQVPGFVPPLAVYPEAHGYDEVKRLESRVSVLERDADAMKAELAKLYLRIEAMERKAAKRI